MKNTLKLALAVFSFYSLSAQAAILPGSVTGFGMLSCVMSNFTGSDQIVDQVQYQYVCNHGPRDPYHSYFEVRGCFGLCEVRNGATLWHNNGPFTQNCMLVMATCTGYSHPAPTPVPSPSPIVTPTP